MSWINLLTCGLRFFAFIWAELPMIVWRILEKEDILNRELAEYEVAPDEHDVNADVEKDEADVIWIAEQKRKTIHKYVFEDGAEALKDKPVLRNRQLWAALTNSELHYETAFVIFPLIAVLSDEPLYSAYSLLEMCFWESSRPVTDALLKNLGKIYQLVVLAFLYLYLQMVLGMFTIKDGFAQDYCSNMFQCLQSMTDVTIRDYGVFDMLGYPEDVYRYPSNIIDALGIHEEMREAAVFMMKKPIWDVTFQIMFSYVLIAMVCGIIVDAFSTLKSEREAAEKDLKNVCFVCNLERWRLDKEGLGFDRHIKHEHDPRMYFYFLLLIKNKHRNDLTGQERYVYDNVWPEDGRSNTCWLPRMMTFSLHKHFDTMDNEVAQVSESLKGLNSAFIKGCGVFESFEARLKMLHSRLPRTRN